MIDQYRSEAIYLAVLEEGRTYIEGLSKAFEVFFRSFDSKISWIERDIHTIENKYRQSKGKAARYVCASKECLTAMNSKMPYLGAALEIDGSLAEAIYNRVKKYSLLSVKSDNEDYFSAIFDEDIVKYFGDKLMEAYASDIDVDIITAIEKEAEYEKGIVDSKSVEEYVKDVIDSSKILAVPFIEKPIGEEKEPLNSSTYNDELCPDDDSPRAMLIKEQLKDFGGEPDSDIPKNMILFYKSFYGLRANELSKFAPPQRGETFERSGGEYFKAYYELVSKVHPITSKSKVITPHIDRWWHNVTMMPDLDEKNQEDQLNNIYSAFFWALLSNKIGLYPVGPNQYAYRLRDSIMGKDEDTTLTVSNGTPCDQIYEVLDAMSVYPELVMKIMESVDDLMRKELEVGKTVFDNELFDYYSNFIVKQLGDEESTTVRSIFEIPFILKKSMTPEIYNEKNTLRLMDIVISETCRIARHFSAENDYPNNVGKIFKDHYDLLVSHMDEYDESVFLFDELTGKLQLLLKENGSDYYKDFKKRTTEKKGTK